jgi:DNA adenine methylase
MDKEKIYVPPIKIQGKKTKLVSFVQRNLPLQKYDVWIEPFMGSGVVGFNIKPQKAIFADSNPHIINFYNGIKNGDITPLIVRNFLEEHGQLLFDKGQDYFNEVRKRFNQEHSCLDFLFLNRSCFNGLIRFNRKFEFNVPYGHKPQRFSKSYITKITNQIQKVEFLIKNHDWIFVCQDFIQTIQQAKPADLIYCDPPYIGRHVDYYDSWAEADEINLVQYLDQSQARFIVSTWHSNKYRQNEYLLLLWQNYHVVTTEHFYHLGGKEENRRAITEALILNYDPNELVTKSSF